MKILFLGYSEEQTSLIDFLRSENHKVEWTDNKKICPENYELTISFGYRYIIPEKTLKKLNRPIINLHISYLPFNRGAHPNFWSHYEGTITGVTIHEIDAGIDTGKIYFRKEIILDDQLTLKDSYYILKKEAEKLFIENFKEIESSNYKPLIDQREGSYHEKAQLPDWVSWDMKIQEIKNYDK
tara:strand:+ start:1703 stop:2251 length:549 start_codon:yes stop_codon:yes gene_type:complete